MTKLQSPLTSASDVFVNDLASGEWFRVPKRQLAFARTLYGRQLAAVASDPSLIDDATGRGPAGFDEVHISSFAYNAQRRQFAGFAKGKPQLLLSEPEMKTLISGYRRIA